MTVKIARWLGRLGNNIVEVINCLHIAIYLNHVAIIPVHDFFKATHIMANGANTITTLVLTDDTSFYDRKTIQGVDPHLFNENKIAVLTILRNIFVIRYSDVPKAQDNDLHIHIRSGDIFGKNPHKGYILPPLSFYTQIIDTHNFEKIRIVAEDNKNPCIEALLSKYPHIEYNKASLMEDAKIIVGAKNIVFGIGSFVPGLLYFNEEVKQLFYPCNSYTHQLPELKDTVLKHEIDMTDYIAQMGPWNNTIEQCGLMMEY